MTEKDIRDDVADLRDAGVPIWVSTWSPGDGTTRYRFFDEDVSYFRGPQPLATCLGAGEADAWLTGFARGWALKEEAVRLLGMPFGAPRPGPTGEQVSTRLGQARKDKYEAEREVSR